MNQCSKVKERNPQIAKSIPGFADDAKRPGRPLLGVIEGEGIGPEVVGACLEIAQTLEEATGIVFDIRRGGKIGKEALRESGLALTPEVVDFCESLFADGGAFFCGPGGARFVYDLRRRFDLYCKLVPLKPMASLSDTGPLRPQVVADVDILVVRENISGFYFPDSSLDREADGLVARYAFEYREPEVNRILLAAMNAAKLRRGRLCVVHKPGGIEVVSQLWLKCAKSLDLGKSVELEFLEVDNANYQLIADPRRFDVVVTPNMFGDVLADGASVLLGSRGMSYSANFGPGGRSAYQTGHGAAYDIAGRDIANPLGQMLSFAMMLHETFGLTAQSLCLQAAIDEVLAAGWRTRDVMASGCREIGTREMTRRVKEAFRERLNSEAAA